MECLLAFSTEKESSACAEEGVMHRRGIIDYRRLFISVAPPGGVDCKRTGSSIAIDHRREWAWHRHPKHCFHLTRSLLIPLLDPVEQRLPLMHIGIAPAVLPAI